jgi:lipopolysaccharide/colanic/teichoic acid biosynthesis glycosyltransferase
MIRVLSVAIPSRLLTLFLSEGVILFACYLFGAWVDPDVGDLDAFLRLESGGLRILVVVLAILGGLYFRDLYKHLRIRNRVALGQELCMIFGVAFVVQGVINYLSHDLTIPRRVMIVGSVLSLICIFCWRLVFAAAGDGAANGGLIFLGMSPTIGKVARYLLGHPELGLSPSGYLDERISVFDPTEGDRRPEDRISGERRLATAPPLSLPRLGTMADLDIVVEETHPASIVIGRRETIKPWWTDDFLELYFGGVHTQEAATLYENAFGRVCMTEVWPQDLIFTDDFEPRALDSHVQTAYSIFIAALLAIVLLPVTVIIALCLKLSSREPVFLREQRVGLHGVPFTMYSFRSRFRGTRPLVRPPFLDRTRLRAMPRLLNVIAGQMALVGPQPERPEFAARLAQAIPFYSQRHRVKPGLTGWEQIHRDPLNPLDFVCRFEFDLYYMKHLSPSLDSVVLLLWLKKALVGDLAAI